MTTALPYEIDRAIVIGAVPEVVFRYFTDSARWAAWWGAGSTIEPHVGGRVLVRHPNGVEFVGHVTEISPPASISFTYGHAKGTPFGAGESLVTIRLDPVAAGTRLRLHHAFATQDAALEHVQGWRFQLSLFANAVANELHADAATLVDRWFAMWSSPDAAVRDLALETLVSSHVSMRDRFSRIDGLADLRAHLAAVHRFMPGMTLHREAEVRHCQGVVLAEWVARAKDGQVRGRGINVFTLNALNRIESVTGLWTA